MRVMQISSPPGGLTPTGRSSVGIGGQWVDRFLGSDPGLNPMIAMIAMNGYR